MIAPADNRGDGRGRGVEPEQGELFEKVLNASYPSPGSLAGRVLAVLLKGRRLRQLDWLENSWRLSASIQELKYLGWPVISAPVQIPGRKRSIAEYCLPGWVLREVGAHHG